MPLIMQPLDLSYRHKKFDAARKRSLSETSNNEGQHSSLHVDESSNCSSEFDAFKMNHNLRSASTPLKKRRKLQLDSGIDLTATSPGTPQSRITSADSDISKHTESLNRTADISSLALPNISDATLRDICKYHGNMVRKFPKKERSPKDQERRNKNTIACRMSRRVKKLEHVAIEEQYKQQIIQHFQLIEESIRATAYFNYITRLLSKEPLPLGATQQSQSPEFKMSAKNFTIDYLMRASN